MAPYQFPLDEYFARIGINYSDSKKFDRLEQLHRANVYNIAFENFDIHLGRAIDLKPTVVDEKLLRHQRGGYCFELNGLFIRALEATGFDVRPILARVHLRGDPPGRTHQLALVNCQSREYLVDVGFGGGTLRSPLSFELNYQQEQDGILFRVSEHSLGYMLQRQENGVWVDLYSFDLSPVLPGDIALANYFTSTHPQSLFTRSRIAVLCHPQGETRLLNFDFSTHDGNAQQKKVLPDSSFYLEELKTFFNIDLEVPYSKLREITECG